MPSQEELLAFRSLVCVLAFAIALGGGGARYGISNLAVQLIAIGALAINFRRVADFLLNAPWQVRLLALASMALPVFQCIPLPPSIWRALPGRDLVEQSLVLVGLQQKWFPLSLDRGRTIGAFFATIAPFTVLVLSWRLHTAQRESLLRLLVVAALGVVALGAVQLVSGNTLGIIYPETVQGVDLFGTFANRNSAGVFFAIAFAAALCAARSATSVTRRLLAFAAAIVIAVADLLTHSRSGVALLGMMMAVFGGLFLLNLVKVRAGMSLRSIIFAVAIVALVIVGALATLQSRRIEQTVERFSMLSDERPRIWEDATRTAQRYWPVGAGVSTFDEVFQVDESLEYINPRKAARAHNEMIEVAVESGVAGLALLAGWTMLFLWMSYVTARSRPQDPAILAAVSLVALALQSILDYPLRNQALLCIAAMMLGLLIASGGLRGRSKS